MGWPRARRSSSMNPGVEAAIVEAVPHTDGCGENRLCHCGAVARRTILVTKISRAVTREGHYVYLRHDATTR
jgi:hypothetical protein